MPGTNTLLVLFFCPLVALGIWERKTLRQLPDDERLKGMDCQSKFTFWGLLPLPVLLIGFWGFTHVDRQAIFPAFVLFIILLGLSVAGRAYAMGRQLAALGVSPSYLALRTKIALIRGVALGAFFAAMMWNAYQVVHPR